MYNEKTGKLAESNSFFELWKLTKNLQQSKKCLINRIHLNLQLGSTQGSTRLQFWQQYWYCGGRVGFVCKALQLFVLAQLVVPGNLLQRACLGVGAMA